MPAGLSGPRPTPIYCPYPATRPHYSIEKLSPVCATRNIERVDGKSQKAFKSLCADRVQRDEEKRKRKREKVRMSLTVLRKPTIRWPIVIPANKLYSAASHPTPHHPGRWVATIATIATIATVATSQAGTNKHMKDIHSVECTQV